MKIKFKEKINWINDGITVLKEYLNIDICNDGVLVEAIKGDFLSANYKNNVAIITYSSRVQFFRGLGLLVENIKSEQEFSIEERPVFANLSASFDMSRNGVLTVSAMKDILCKMSLMGYNQAMMYTEETYEIEGYPFFGYLRGKYSKDEIKELDDFAYILGIELVPCIQTLGHLERFLHWNAAAKFRDTPDVLLVGTEETYTLIEAMLKSARECYRTEKIHVGMDEAMNLGLGGYLRDNGYEDGFSIMKKHIERVCQLTDKYGFKPMMWSDMYFRCASKTHDYYEENIKIPQNIIDEAPENMQLVYWDYYHDNKAFYDHYIKLHKKFKAETWFAGGMWTWIGPCIDYDLFFKTSLPALEACIENNIKNVIITCWGDDGAETNVLTTLLGLQVYAEYCYKGEYNRDKVFNRFAFCTAGNAEALCRIAAFNKTELLSPESDIPNAAKFLLYQDPMIGLYDMDIENLGFESNYEKLEAEFSKYSNEKNQWQLIYKFYEKLAAVLKYKAELGIQIYNAYHDNNMDMLSTLSKKALLAAEECENLKEVWQELWFLTNRPFGFEVIDVRLSGIKGRLQSCSKRLTQYINKTIDTLEEFNELRQNILCKQNSNILNGVYFWKDIVSSSKAF